MLNIYLSYLNFNTLIFAYFKLITRQSNYNTIEIEIISIQNELNFPLC